MAVIRGASLALTQAVSNDSSILLSRPTNADTIVIDGTTFLYVPTAIDDAIQVFSVSDTGTATAVGNVTDTAGTALQRAQVVRTFEVDGNPFLAVTGYDDDGITVYSLSSTAPYLTFSDTAFDVSNPDFELDGAWNLTVVENGSTATLIVAGQVDDGLSSFSVDATGALTSVTNMNSTTEPDFDVNGPFFGEPFTIGSNTYLAVGSEFGGASLNVLRIQSDSSLVYHSKLDDPGFDFEGFQWAPAVIGSKAYLFSASFDNDEAALVEFSPGGSFKVIDRFPSPLLDNAIEAKRLDVGDEIYFVVSSYGNSAGLSIFRFDQDVPGVELVQSIQDDTGQGNLSRVHVGVPFEINGVQFVAATSEFGSDLNIYEVGGADDILNGTQIDDDIAGGGGDDQINGFAGDDLIDGGRGTDIIYAGSGNDTVVASIGNDRLFAGSGFDRLDLTTFNGEANGVVADMLGERIILSSGSRQFATGFERIDGTAQNDTLTGNEDNNDLRGNSGDDTLRGREGNDFLRGGNGVDFLVGAEGNDYLTGGAGNDIILNGGEGNDTVLGDAGMDSLYGGFGDDDMQGGTDDDLMRGNEGNDFMVAGSGNDDMRGGSGNDTLSATSDNNFLSGDDGNDRLVSGLGDDTMTGGTGADVFVFDTTGHGGGGFNTVNDYTDGSDQIDLVSYGFANEAAVLALASARSWGVRIDLADGQTIALFDANLGDLGAGDFIL